MIRSHCSRVCRSIASLMLLVAATAGMALADELKLDGRTFTVPSGFTIERIAGPPLVDRPITAAFDDEGRLYVADSSGSNDKVEEAARGEAAPDRAAGRHRRRRKIRQAGPSSPTR